MRAFVTILLILSLFACRNAEKKRLATSYWVSIRDSFPMKNLDKFVMDSSLNNYRNFPRIKDSVIRSVVFDGDIYLYSWQERGSGNTEFTVIVDKGEYGMRIVYFIFSKTDKLLSSSEIAGIAGEGGVLYEGTCKFITKDSLMKIHAASTETSSKQKGENKRKGDSIFSYLTISKTGTITEKEFKRKFELNL